MAARDWVTSRRVTKKDMDITEYVRVFTICT